MILKDEPTSGLDAASAAEIMALLRRLASDTGVMIVTSVHQPSTRVFNSFDQVQHFGSAKIDRKTNDSWPFAPNVGILIPDKSNTDSFHYLCL